MPRPAPALVLVAPPATGETSCVLREAGERQVWQRVTLAAHQLDYFNLDSLWPGWECWHHAGRYLSDGTLRTLNWLGAPQYPQPLPPGF